MDLYFLLKKFCHLKEKVNEPYVLITQVVQVCKMCWNACSCKCFIFQSALQFFILWNVMCKYTKKFLQLVYEYKMIYAFKDFLCMAKTKTRNTWDVIDDHSNNFPGENMGKLVAFSKQYLQLFDPTLEHPSTMSIKKICTSH